MDLKKRRVLLRYFIGAIALLYVFYSGYTYGGLFRYMAELSIRNIGTYESSLVGIMVFIMAYTPLYILSVNLLVHFNIMVRENKSVSEVAEDTPSTEGKSPSDIEKELKQQAGVKKLMKFYDRFIIGVVAIGMIVLLFTAPIVHFWETIIDNPTDKAIRVSIDAITYDIPAKTWQRYPVSRGVHAVELNGKVVGSFERGWLWTDGNSILNPTLYTYILTDTIFTTEKRAGNMIPKSLEVNGKTYTGIDNPRMVSDLYIRNSGANGWNYGLWENLPYTRSQTTDYEKMTKIFHKEEFESEYSRFQAE